MAHHPSVSRTTHTLEMAQIEELNERLTQRRAEGRVITAANLGLADATVLSGRAAGGKVSPSAVVTAIGWDGDPEFPYLHACFSGSGSEQASSGTRSTGDRDGQPWADLHSAALQELCRRLGLHQVWGIGAASQHHGGG